MQDFGRVEAQQVADRRDGGSQDDEDDEDGDEADDDGRRQVAEMGEKGSDRQIGETAFTAIDRLLPEFSSERLTREEMYRMIATTGTHADLTNGRRRPMDG